ncbi:hypothetical protein MRB53_022984 [Persea americana]|uniref:Uncharacterized protein n=1 Tax=Persea americana TaxID=3435 RepID=A0ACC2L8Z0_PERAE|nr:hypothetical protein MRB53_022984 [Persea americana]
MRSSVREMLISEVKRTDLCFENYSNERLTGKDSKCSLSCLAATNNEQSVIVSLEHETHELLSLFNISAQYLECEINKFSTFHSIKVFRLGRWQISSKHHIEITDTKFLESLGVMKNLRYLSVQGISRTMLSDSLVHLTNLQILDVRACHNLETLPVGMESSMNLTHLDVSECSLLDSIPNGLG